MSEHDLRPVRRVLVLTVGGSCAPVVTSIRENNPDRVIFLCSGDTVTAKGSYITVEGQGKVCGGGRGTPPDQPNILEQTALSRDRAEIIRIDRFDDLNACYRAALEALTRARETYPEAEIVADYTGGTKSMSAGLGAAALDVEGTSICVVKGIRADLTAVQDGTQSIRITRTNRAALLRQRNLIFHHLKRFDYAAAYSLARHLLHTPDLPQDLEHSLQRTALLAQAFDAWDRFDHREALRLLKPFRRDQHQRVRFLEHILISRRLLEEDGVTMPRSMHGFEVLEDLLLNAERRARQHRYDDAVARLYRAVELTGQLYLKVRHDLQTGNLDVARLPESLQPRYEALRDQKGTVAIGLVKTYELLAELDTERFGPCWTAWKNRLLDALQVRNHSILAHGFQPVSAREFSNLQSTFSDFIANVTQCMNVSLNLSEENQLPISFPET